jgi:hypothetical protein
MSGWDRPELAHLTPLERKCAALWFKIDPATVEGPPVGMIVGEMPGPNTSPSLPMFPYPANSAGGRLLKISGLTPGQYLGRLLRVDLFKTYQEKWDPRMAQHLAVQLLEGSPVKRIVVLGQHVGAAFGFDSFFQHAEFADMNIVCIPHPSGRSPIYNDMRAKIGAAAAIHFAANLMLNRGGK